MTITIFYKVKIVIGSEAHTHTDNFTLGASGVIYICCVTITMEIWGQLKLTLLKMHLATELCYWDTFIIPLASPGNEWQQLADRIREIKHP